jgi:hypothetical protein
MVKKESSSRKLESVGNLYIICITPLNGSPNGRSSADKRSLRKERRELSQK